MTQAPSDPIRHHLGDDLILAYAAGSLPEALSLMVACHVSLCDTCRAQLEACEALGGALIEDQPAADLDPGALESALAVLDKGHTDPPAPPAPAECAVLPAPLCSYVGGDLSAVRWHGFGAGVKQAILPTGPGAMARLILVPGGGSLPEHTHGGLELTLVLQGAFSDELGSFTRGDVETADASVQHEPVARPGTDCICLAVTDAPLQFSDLMPRVVQP